MPGVTLGAPKVERACRLVNVTLLLKKQCLAYLCARSRVGPERWTQRVPCGPSVLIHHVYD